MKTIYKQLRKDNSTSPTDLCDTYLALHCQVGLASGRSLGRDWRRRPGRPRARWTDQLRNDTGSVPANLETDRPSYGAVVERRDGPSWLHDDDDRFPVVIKFPF